MLRHKKVQDKNRDWRVLQANEQLTLNRGSYDVRHKLFRGGLVVAAALIFQCFTEQTETSTHTCNTYI